MVDLLEKYRAAERMLPQYTRNLVINGSPKIRWLDGVFFSYGREKRTESGKETVNVRVNSLTGEEETGSEEAWRACQNEAGPPQGTSAGNADPAQARRSEKSGFSVSPDGHCRLFYRGHNLYLLDSGGETQLTFDGEPLCEYGCYVDVYSQITVKRQGAAEHPLVLWSPDRRYFVTYRADRRAVKKLYAIESFGDSPQDIRPRLWEYPCPFAGDSDGELPHFALCVGDVKSRKMTMVQAPPYLDPVFTSEEKSFVRWLPDSSGFYFTWFSRGLGRSGCTWLRLPPERPGRSSGRPRIRF